MFYMIILYIMCIYKEKTCCVIVMPLIMFLNLKPEKLFEAVLLYSGFLILFFYVWYCVC